MKVLSIFIFIFLVFAFPARSAEKEGFQFKSQPEIEQVRPKKPVRIKLKRLSNGKYMWEITGDNVEDITKADRKLREFLKVE